MPRIALASIPLAFLLTLAAACSSSAPAGDTTSATSAGGGTAAQTSATTGEGGAGGAGGAGGGQGGGGGATPEINEGFIGGPCTSDADCPYEGGFCLTEDKGFPGGMCSLDCALYCPDQDGAVGTFCVDPAKLGTTAGDGLCTTRCVYGPSATGCREGYQCKPLPRHNDPAKVVYSCVPGSDSPFPLSACHQELLARGIEFSPAPNPLDHPEGLPNLLCDIEDPVWIEPVIHGVTYRPDDIQNAPAPLFVACPLALAIDKASDMLAMRGGTDLVHLGTYNCRVIAGTETLSEHGLARALDIAGIRKKDGAVYVVLDDWEKDQPNPTTAAGKFLKELVESYHQEKVFNIILTPDYNEAHANHFHVDLTPGSDFLK